MAIVKRNPVLEGLSGRVGDLVFRVRGKTTIVARRPSRRAPGEPLAEGQKRTVSRFREAVAFAREARDRPAFRSLSRMLRGFSPYHLAIQDFISEPVIEDVVEEGADPSGTVLVVTVSERVGVRTLQAKRVRESADAPSKGPSPMSAEGRGEGPSEGHDEVPAEPPTGAGKTPAKGEKKGSTYSTPAAMFFRRDRPADPADHSARLAKPATTPPSPETSTPPARGETTPGEPSVTREGETREPREEGAPPVSLSTWKVVVPGGGEVEIVAFDYAGNRATRRVKVGS
jgi:hypothetical protein